MNSNNIYKESNIKLKDGFEMMGSALFSPCEIYRYRLNRVWDKAKPAIAFCMANPSVADSAILDNTVRRCLNYAISWGYGSLEVVNAFALRSTDPKGLRKINDPIGPDNDEAIISCRKEVDIMVAAWGTIAQYKNRGNQVHELLKAHGGLHYLELSKNGIPKHPLYLKKNLIPQELI